MVSTTSTPTASQKTIQIRFSMLYATVYLNFRILKTHCRSGEFSVKQNCLIKKGRRLDGTGTLALPRTGDVPAALKDCGPQGEKSGLKTLAPLPSLRFRYITPQNVRSGEARPGRRELNT